MKLKFIFLILLSSFCSFSQNSTTEQKINTFLVNYFQQDREIIHVHFNKLRYVNTEEIAFKGYVFNKNNNTPSLNTTNVQLVIYNEKQEVIQKQLLYTAAGTFNQTILLNDSFVSGKYYFHFYTNWMNNFKEDDSFIQTIEIIDKNELYYLKPKTPNLATAKVQVFPENGIIIDGITNIVGVKITDCNQVGISISSGVVVDANSNVISKFETNTLGYGAFFIIPELNKNYFLKIDTDSLNLTQPLPQTQATGIAISYNTNLANNSLAINVKTNSLGLQKYKNKKLTLLIHQNKNGIQKQFSFDNEETNQIIRFNKKYLSNGINSIRIIDENYNELGERILYNDQFSKLKLTMEARNTLNDSISLFGKIEKEGANASITVLPEENSCLFQNKSLLGTFMLNAYLEHPENNTDAYFDTENSSRNDAIYLLLLNQVKSKYHWENILAGAPMIAFPPKVGVTISGIVEKKLNPNETYKIILFSFKDKVWEETILSKDNKFRFENFYAKDATSLLLQLVNEKNKAYHAKIVAQIESTTAPFTGNLFFEKDNCPIVKSQAIPFNFKNPVFDTSSNQLNEVKITNAFKEPIFTHQNEIGNSFATPFKIAEDDFGNVLNFLDMHGFSTGLDETASVYVTSKRNFRVKNQYSSSPQIFIDESKVMDLNSLYNLNMVDIDEIYIDKMGGFSAQGIIKIYLRNGVNRDFYDPKFSILVVSSGFSKNLNYKEAIFDSQKEFYNFGTLKWEQNIGFSGKQNFEIQFPKGNQKAIQVVIEGFTPDGQLFSESKKIEINTTLK